MAEQEQASQSQQPEEGEDQAKKIIKLVLIIVGVLVLLSVIGIFLLFQVGENIFESATNTEIEKTEQGVKIESEEGTFESQAEIPDDFPEEIPLYEDAEVVSSSKISDADRAETTYTASFTTEDGVDEVADFYESSLEDETWTVNRSASYNNVRQLTAEKDALRLTVLVNADGSNETTTFTLSVRESEDAS